MTSAELASIIAGVRWAGDEKVSVASEEVYYAATQAQKEILARTTFLEGKGQLALVANQEEYTFPVQTITNVQVVTGTVQVTMTGHPFTTNDEAVLWGILGSVEANGRFKLTKVDANTVSLNGLTTATAYVSGGQMAHIITGAKAFLPSGIRILSDSAGTVIQVIEKKSKSWIELHRNNFFQSSTPLTPITGQKGAFLPSTPSSAYVLYFYEEYTDPITIGLMGIPALPMITEPIFYRKHIDGYDDISATRNPILPSMFDTVLRAGTFYHAFMYRGEKGAAMEADKWGARFEMELRKFSRVHGGQKYVPQFDDSGLVW